MEDDKQDMIVMGLVVLSSVAIWAVLLWTFPAP